MNRFDEFAVEESVLIREIIPGTRIDAVSVGPESEVTSVKRAIGMGADRGVHILTQADGYLNPRTIAALIADYARDRHYDLILTGVMSEDGMHGMVGPMLAEMLSMPCATSVVVEKILHDRRIIYVEREIEGGYRDAIELKFPALLTIQGGINKPRYPSLSNMLRAKSLELETIVAGLENQTRPCEEIKRVSFPKKSRSGIFLEGNQQEKAFRLLNILREKGLI
jgi:electron transfer flavoprotein beta subunit